MKKKVAIIGTVGIPAKYGGFETLTEHLVEDLHGQYDITVYCSSKKYHRNERTAYYKGARLKFLPLDANGIQSIFYDTWSILHALLYADVLLVLGVAGAWTLPFVRRFTRKRIIISIDGIEWKRDKWNRLAQWYLFWAEKMAVKYSHIDISDNESIQDYTARRYGSLSRIIEYGADHTIRVKPQKTDKGTYPFLNGQYAFKVCRIEPENNVHLILEAFAELLKTPLVIVGNWDNSPYGQSLKARYSTRSHIHLLDPIYEQRALDLLRSNAYLYLHGHSAGGTNPSLVEAMYLGLPIIAYGVSYNRTTTENQALYFHDKMSLKNIIVNTSIYQFEQLSKRMEHIAQRRYHWKLISSKYALLIEEALEVTKKPSATPQISKLEIPEAIDLEVGHLSHQQLFYEKR